MGIIYKITNKANGKVYIGQTVQSMSARWKQHISVWSPCKYLSRAIKKYGADVFTIEKIDAADTVEELNAKEMFWITHYDSTNQKKGYNILCGGGSFGSLAQETKDILSVKIAEKWRDEKYRARVLPKLRAATQTSEFREGRSKERKANWRDSQYRDDMLQKMTSAGYREKQSEKHKRKYADADYKARWIIANRERHGAKIECVETGKKFSSIGEAAAFICRSDTSIRKVLNGKRLTAGGYHWRLANKKKGDRK